jgi:hypothetical protein
MKLHLDQPAFETLLLRESESSAIRADILEIDYYFTLILNELAKYSHRTINSVRSSFTCNNILPLKSIALLLH